MGATCMIEGNIVWIDPLLMQTYMQSEGLHTLEALIEDAERSNRWDTAKVLAGTEDKNSRESKVLWFDPNFPPPTHEPLLTYAQSCLDEYIKHRPEAVHGTPDFYAENYSLLKYEEGQGYHALHGDAAPWTNDITSGRHISQIIYLNDVEEGGETIFPIQEATIKPRAGKCLTFPSSWSHSHNTLKAVDTKYCISIFYSFFANAPSQSSAESSNMTVEEFIEG